MSGHAPLPAGSAGTGRLTGALARSNAGDGHGQAAGEDTGGRGDPEGDRLLIPVAVTGMGAVSALGTSPEELFARLLSGESGVRQPPDWLHAPPPGKDWRTAALPTRRSCSEIALDAAIAALGGRSAADVWIVCGTTAADMAQGEAAWMSWHRGEAAPGLLWPQLPDRVAGTLRAALGARPPALAVSTACTAGAVAIEIAADLVASGQAPAALAVGADTLSRLLWLGFGALDLQGSGPARPFDRRRSGLNLGEGAAALLLEPAGGARRPLALLTGRGSASDAWSLVAPHPEGPGGRAAIRLALGEGGSGLRRVPGWVHAHATGTRQNDAVEAGILGDLLPGVPVSNTKGALGHTLGGAGALGAVVAIRSLLEGWIPPSTGTGDPEYPLDLVLRPRRFAAGQPRSCLSLAFGFGGGASALLWEAA